jgi:hypothetical protein
MKLSVPYYSQFLDVEDSFWMLRACGATALKMVAEFQGKELPSIVDVCNEAKEKGGYDMQNGWIHDYIVNKAKELGLNAHRTERDLPIIDEIIASLDAGNPVIVSIEKRVLEQKRFHIVVIVGYEKGEVEESGVIPDIADSYRLKSNSCFYYHEPESTDRNRGAYRSCDIETFKEYWRGKAIFITK